MTKPIRAYTVTMTLKSSYYSGGRRVEGDVVTVGARSAAEAMCISRRQYRDEEGSERVPATFSVKLKKD